MSLKHKSISNCTSVAMLFHVLWQNRHAIIFPRCCQHKLFDSMQVGRCSQRTAARSKLLGGRSKIYVSILGVFIFCKMIFISNSLFLIPICLTSFLNLLDNFFRDWRFAAVILQYHQLLIRFKNFVDRHSFCGFFLLGLSDMVETNLEATNSLNE